MFHIGQYRYWLVFVLPILNQNQEEKNPDYYCQPGEATFPLFSTISSGAVLISLHIVHFHF